MWYSVIVKSRLHISKSGTINMVFVNDMLKSWLFITERGNVTKTNEQNKKFSERHSPDLLNRQSVITSYCMNDIFYLHTAQPEDTKRDKMLS